MGDKKHNINEALSEISEYQDIKLLQVAPFYKTEPWGNVNQDWFLNTVAEIDTETPPEELLNIVLHIEAEMGRVRKEKWGPRCIDIDILLYGNHIIDTPNLKVPHSEMKNRAFVMVPLSDLNPQLKLPTGGIVSELAKEVAKTQIVEKAIFFDA